MCCGLVSALGKEPELPRFSGERLPVSPAQEKSWNAATTEIPAVWIDAARTLSVELGWLSP